MRGLLVQVAGWAVRAPFEFSVTDSGITGSTNFGTRNFGAEPDAGSKRYIAVGVTLCHNGARSINSVSIGGTVGDPVVELNNYATPCVIYIREVPTGTTGNVSITVSGSNAGYGFAVARIINPKQPLGFDVASNIHSLGNVDLSLNVPSGGAALALVQCTNGGTYTWTGLTEFRETDINSNEIFGAASDSGLLAASPRTIIADCSDNTPEYLAGVAASWG